VAGDGEHGQGHVRKRRSASRRRVMRRLPMRGHHRSAMVALLVLAGMAGFATSAAADGAHGQQAPRMHFGDRVKLTTWCRSSAAGCDLLCQWPHRQHRNRTCGRATAGPRPTLVMATCRRCDRSPVRRQIGSPVAHIHLSSLHDRRPKSALSRNVGPSSYRCGTSRESAHVSSERATPDGPRCPLPVRAASSRLARPRQQRTNDSAALR
jgi:hypothetical protein